MDVGLMSGGWLKLAGNGLCGGGIDAAFTGSCRLKPSGNGLDQAGTGAGLKGRNGLEPPETGLLGRGLDAPSRDLG